MNSTVYLYSQSFFSFFHLACFIINFQKSKGNGRNFSILKIQHITETLKRTTHLHSLNWVAKEKIEETGVFNHIIPTSERNIIQIHHFPFLFQKIFLIYIAFIRFTNNC